MSAIQIDNVGIAHVCTRNRRTAELTTVRKFITFECKARHEVSIRGGKIREIVTLRVECKRDCRFCAAQIEKVKNLINSGK